MVWVHDSQWSANVRSKLSYQWKGPYVVVGKTLDVTYHIHASDGLASDGLTSVIHFNRLKPCVSDVPAPELGLGISRDTGTQTDISMEIGIPMVGADHRGASSAPGLPSQNVGEQVANTDDDDEIRTRPLPPQHGYTRSGKSYLKNFVVVLSKGPDGKVVPPISSHSHPLHAMPPHPIIELSHAEAGAHPSHVSCGVEHMVNSMEVKRLDEALVCLEPQNCTTRKTVQQRVPDHLPKSRDHTPSKGHHLQ
jgi:hypothetical protein